MISVIIPTYNRRHTLERTLVSVYAQTRADCQVIVADDGSTDDTLDYLQSQPVVTIPLPHSGKPAVARNSGIACARGELVAFLDSDDSWEPTALEELSAALVSAPDAGFAFCDYAPAPAPAASGRHATSVRGPIDIFESLLNTDFLATGSLLIRREAILTVGEFDPRLWVADDWDYWLRLAAQYQAVHVSQPLVRVHAAPDSISRAPGGTIFADNKLITRKMAAWCQAHRPAASPLARRIHRRSLMESARYEWHHGGYFQMVRDLMALLDT